MRTKEQQKLEDIQTSKRALQSQVTYALNEARLLTTMLCKAYKAGPAGPESIRTDQEKLTKVHLKLMECDVILHDLIHGS